MVVVEKPNIDVVRTRVRLPTRPPIYRKKIMFVLLGLLGSGILLASGWTDSNVYLATAGVLLLYFSSFTQGFHAAENDALRASKK